MVLARNYNTWLVVKVTDYLKNAFCENGVRRITVIKVSFFGLEMKKIQFYILI